MRTLTDNDRQRIVEEAMRWLDVPYRLFGNDKRGVDCSQLVMAVYRNALTVNLILSSDMPFLSSWLFRSLEIIPKANLQIGDLIFYCNQQPNNRLATHVAIYLGNNQVIHASQKFGKVVIDSIHDLSNEYMMLEVKDVAACQNWQPEMVFP